MNLNQYDIQPPFICNEVASLNEFVYLLNPEIYLQSIQGKNRFIFHILCGGLKTKKYNY
jgi:hypothetical protein